MSYNHVKSDIGMGFFGISFDAGGIWEGEGVDPDLPRGTSHLMEHLMCKTYEDLYPEMRAVDVQDNAYTSDNQVVFWASGLSEYLGYIAESIANKFFNAKELWTKEQFENEKKIVLQEYGDWFNDQLWGTMSNFMRKYYNYCGPIGIRKDIEGFTYEQSLEVAARVFSKPKYICQVGGDPYQLPTVEYQSRDPRRDIKFGNYDIELENLPKEDQTSMLMMYKNLLPIEQASKLKLIITCLNGGLESPLYQEVREKRGLAYAVHTMANVMGGQVTPMTILQTNSDNESELKGVLNDFFSKDMSDWFDKKRFSICKQGLLINQKKAERLPHEGVSKTVMSDYNPYNGLDDFEYDDAVKFANEVFNTENFVIDSY